MKEKIIPVIILLLVIWSVKLFSENAMPVTSGIDNLKVTLDDINNTLPTNSNVSLSYVDVDSAVGLRIFYYIRYILAPRYISLAPGSDTILTIFGRLPDEAKFRNAVGKNKVLWLKKGNDHAFILTRKNAGKQ